MKLVERFWSMAACDPSGCWEWQGHISDEGYGIFQALGKVFKAHRFAYEIAVDQVPRGGPGGRYLVCHHCDNPRCVRPEHLFLGSDADNNRDKMAKGRGRFLRGGEHPATIIGYDVVEAIRQSTESHRALAKFFGISKSHVGRIRRGEGRCAS